MFRIDCGTIVHREYLFMGIFAYFYDYLIYMNDIYNGILYSRSTCCQIVGIIHISGPGDENIFYTTLCLSVCMGISRPYWYQCLLRGGPFDTWGAMVFPL